MGNVIQFRPRKQEIAESARNPVMDGIAFGVLLGTFAALMRGHQPTVTRDTPPRYVSPESA